MLVAPLSGITSASSENYRYSTNL
nr:hypothetical protein [Streptomyces sp. WAC 01420]